MGSGPVGRVGSDDETAEPQRMKPGSKSNTAAGGI